LWLLDPDDLNIGASLASIIAATLNSGTNVLQQTTASGTGGTGNITVDASIAWNTTASLTLSAYNNIIFNSNGSLISTGGGDIFLRADNAAQGRGGTGNERTVLFFNESGNQIVATNGGSVSLYYNPTSYTNPTNYSGNVSVSGGGTLTAYMLVNNVTNLQDIQSNLSGTYALGSKNIDATSFPFTPIGNIGNPFIGILEGQGRTISNLTIAPTSPYNNNTGLFASIGATGQVRNLNLQNVNVTAVPTVYLPGQFVGTLAGQSSGLISNVTVTGSVSNGTAQSGVIAGGLVGQLQSGGLSRNPPPW
jgi:hypothetical protein